MGSGYGNNNHPVARGIRGRALVIVHGLVFIEQLSLFLVANADLHLRVR